MVGVDGRCKQGLGQWGRVAEARVAHAQGHIQKYFLNLLES